LENQKGTIMKRVEPQPEIYKLERNGQNEASIDGAIHNESPATISNIHPGLKPLTPSNILDNIQNNGGRQPKSSRGRV
jgi:hypothetical protein